MQALVDNKSGDYFRCLLENGDVLSLHKTCFEGSIEIGDVVAVSFKKDVEATKKQKEFLSRQA